MYAAIEVLAVEEETLRHDTEFLPLHSHIAIHHNYSWRTFRRSDNQRTLLLSTVLLAEGPAPLFLGEEFVVSARREVEKHVPLNVGFDVRLAGILQETGEAQASAAGLLSIARLAGRASGDDVECCGNLELRYARSQFDPRSQVVIDHLQAL